MPVLGLHALTVRLVTTRMGTPRFHVKPAPRASSRLPMATLRARHAREASLALEANRWFTVILARLAPSA
jgi:hypothetical protein